MKKNILKKSIYYTILGFLPLSFAVFFTPIYTKYLDVEQYGILNLYMLYTGIISQIIGLGISRAFFFLYWDVYSDEKKLKQLISNVIGLLLLLQLIYISIGLLFGYQILDTIIKSKESFTYELFILCLFQSSFLVYFELFSFFFRNEEKIKAYTLINVSTLVLLTIGTLIGIIYLSLEARGAIYGRFIGYGLVILISLIYFIKKYGISLQYKRSYMIVIFSIPVFLNALVGAFSSGVDRILIERLDTIENLGIYGFALVFITILEVWFNSINNALAPKILKYLNEAYELKRREIEGLIYLILLSVITVVTLINASIYPILQLLIPYKFHAVTTFVPILMAAFIWRVATSMVTIPFYIKKKTKLFLYNEIGILLLVFIIGYTGYQVFGIIGIAYSIYVVKMIEFIVMYYLSKKVMPLPIQLSKFYLLIGLLSLALFSCSIFDKNSIINSHLLFILPLIVFLITLIYFMKREINAVLLIYRIRNKLI